MKKKQKFLIVTFGFKAQEKSEIFFLNYESIKKLSESENGFPMIKFPENGLISSKMDFDEKLGDAIEDILEALNNPEIDMVLVILNKKFNKGLVDFVKTRNQEGLSDYTINILLNKKKDKCRPYYINLIEGTGECNIEPVSVVRLQYQES